jgi:MFS superfamily sulfate permease-like transporter
VLSGLTLATIGLPAVMGYALIAKMPIVTGLYTFLVPLIVFALVGSSRHLVVAADSATAALLAAGLVGLAAPGSNRYVTLAAVVSILVGLMLALVRVFRLSFVGNFLSHTILIGFLTGVGIKIALGQIPTMLGLHPAGANPLVVLYRTLASLTHVSIPDAILGAVALSSILLLRRFSTRIPGPFIVVSGGIIAGYVLRANHQISYTGHVAPGLPHPALYTIPWNQLGHLSALALSLVIVVVAQSAATARAFAARFSEKVNENRDIVGLSLANLAAGLTGTFPVNGSPTRAAMVYESGGRTRWVSVVAASITLLVLLFLTGPLRYLPTPVLAAVVFSIAVRLIDVKGLRHVAHLRRDEFVVALVAAVTVVTLGVETGIIVAAIFAVINHLRRGYAPTNFLVVLDGSIWGSRPVHSRTPAKPGAYVYRFQASLWYANVIRFVEEVESLLGPETKLVCFDFTSVAAVDYSAGQSLHHLVSDLTARGVTVRFTHVDDSVRLQLEAYQVVAEDSEMVVRSTHEVLDAFVPDDEA